ncbi:MAG: dienelactone hydrolase family protein [Candidatus Hydrogenedentes bacterium]|nr:dienelactone hydrolase family protein [Candidatus Hydrogenedentota bacterium]
MAKQLFLNGCGAGSAFIPLFMLSTLFACSASAWEGFRWDTWREITGISALTLDSPQAGREDLLPLLETGAPGAGPIASQEEWERKRARIESVLSTLIGTPTNLAAPAPAAEVLGEEDLGAYTRRHLRIASEPDDTIPAYLLIPKEPIQSPCPTMIVLHQTQAPGKEEACGMTGDPNMAFAKELVERGYLCIAPDAVGFGERIPKGEQPYYGAHDFYRKHPQWSFFGKMIWDVQRVVDYLETLPEVDKGRIGCIGHSHGAYGTIMGSIFEPRIRVAVASCGFNTLRSDPSPNRWCHLTALLPRLGFYVDDVKTAPLDWHEIVACLAPRSYFNYATLSDDVFPNTENLASIYTQLTSVYALYGNADHFAGALVTGKHSFPPDSRQMVYHWIDRQFELLPANPE